MNEKLVQIMEMLTVDGVKSSIALNILGELDIYLWNGTLIDRHIKIHDVTYITDSDVAAVSAMIEAYKKSQPAHKHNAEI